MHSLVSVESLRAVDGYVLLWDQMRDLCGVHAAIAYVWLLGIVFTLSSISKLRNPARTAMAMVDLGLTKRVSRLLGVGAGMVELVLALSLAGIATGVIDSVVPLLISSVLLGWFLSLLIHHLRNGASFNCYCFGNSSQPLSKSDTIRTALLALTSVVALTAMLGSNTAVSASSRSVLGVVAFAVMLSVVIGTKLPMLLRWNSLIADSNVTKGS